MSRLCVSIAIIGGVCGCSSNAPSNQTEAQASLTSTPSTKFMQELPSCTQQAVKKLVKAAGSKIDEQQQQRIGAQALASCIDLVDPAVKEEMSYTRWVAENDAIPSKARDVARQSLSSRSLADWRTLKVKQTEESAISLAGILAGDQPTAVEGSGNVAQD